MSSTSGRTASERAMHSRCCWPPDRSPPGRPSRSLTSCHSPAFVRQLSISSARPDRATLVPVSLRPGQHVLGDRHGGERVRLLEDHADPAAGLGQALSRVVDVVAVELDPPAMAADGTSSCIRLRMRRNVDLPHPLGPISAVTCPAAIVRETRSRTRCVPNHAEMSTAVDRAPLGGLLVPCSAGWLVPWPSYGGGSTAREVSPIGGGLRPGHATSRHRGVGPTSHRRKPDTAGGAPTGDERRTTHQHLGIVRAGRLRIDANWTPIHHPGIAPPWSLRQTKTQMIEVQSAPHPAGLNTSRSDDRAKEETSCVRPFA